MARKTVLDRKRMRRSTLIGLLIGICYVSSLTVIASLYSNNLQQRIDDKQSIFSNQNREIQVDLLNIASLQYDRSGISTAITLWCEDKTFQFKHLLTLLSLIHVLKSDVVWIMFERFPKSDYYNRWLEDISSQYQFLRFERCKQCCFRTQTDSNELIDLLTRKGGGIIMKFSTFITKLTKEFHNLNGFTIKDNKNNIQVLMMKPRLIHYLYKKVEGGFTYVGNGSVEEEVSQVPSMKCDTVVHKSDNTNRSQCYDLHVYNESLFPRDIWDCTSTFCKDTRKLLYNSPHNVTPLKSHLKSPKILHYIWFGNDNIPMTFMFYLSVLSFINIGGISKVYLHCNNPPVGYYWNKLNQELEKQDILHVVYRTKPQTVFNQSVNVVQHIADVVKADISFKYGGIISDTDVLLVKPLDPDLFLYDFVVGRDIGNIKKFPDEINMGLILSKPGNRFSQKWTNSMKVFHDNDWLWNAGLSTYKIIEYYPHLVHISDHLQVICYRFIFYPTWSPRKRHHNLNVTRYSALYRWIEQTHSFHFTYPEPYDSLSSLKDEQGLTGEIGRFVARRTGLL